MTLQAHDLHAEFPEFAEAIHALKISNGHFSRLFDEYHQVNRDVIRIETNVEPAADAVLEDLKKRRLQLKDELYGMLRQYQV